MSAWREPWRASGRGDGHRRIRVAAAGTLDTAVIDKLPTRQFPVRCSWPVPAPLTMSHEHNIHQPEIGMVGLFLTIVYLAEETQMDSHRIQESNSYSYIWLD